MGGGSRAAKKRAKQKQKREQREALIEERETPDDTPPPKRIKEDPAEEKPKKDLLEEEEVSSQPPSTDDEPVHVLPATLVELLHRTGMTAQQRAKALMALLLQPSDMSVDEFYDKVWETKPLLIQARGSKHRQRFEGLLSLPAIRSMIQNKKMCYGKDLNVTRYEKFADGVKRRVTLDVAPRPGDNDEVEYTRAKSDDVWKYYDDGCTIRLLCPHQHAPSVHALLAGLEIHNGSMMGANAYLTPPQQSQGFAPHYDDIEAFCLQLEGKKRWKVYAPLTKAETLPRTSSADYTEDDLRDVKPELDVILEPGDILYMPRGWIHQACTLPSSVDHHSLHLTVSCMQQWAWADFLDILLPEALEAAANGEFTSLRKGLPRNFLDYMGSVYDSSGAPEILKDRDEKDNISDENTQRERLREAFRDETRNKIMRVAKEAIGMLDAACDQIGKRFLSDRLPPALTPEEQEATQESKQILPTTLCRLVRPGIARLALEDGKAVLYHCKDNSLVYHETPLSPMEFEMDDAPAIEQLVTTVEPRWICVNDLIHDCIEDKVGVAQALYDEGILATAEMAL